MKTTKRNTDKNATSKYNEKKRITDVAIIIETIKESIPEDSTKRNVLESILVIAAEIIASIHVKAGRDVGQAGYKYAVDYLKSTYERILKEEEHG